MEPKIIENMRMLKEGFVKVNGVEPEVVFIDSRDCPAVRVWVNQNEKQLRAGSPEVLECMGMAVVEMATEIQHWCSFGVYATEGENGKGKGITF